jgi:hypothetical protein
LLQSHPIVIQQAASLHVLMEVDMESEADGLQSLSTSPVMA